MQATFLAFPTHRNDALGPKSHHVDLLTWLRSYFRSFPCLLRYPQGGFCNLKQHHLIAIHFWSSWEYDHRLEIKISFSLLTNWSMLFSRNRFDQALQFNYSKTQLKKMQIHWLSWSFGHIEAPWQRKKEWRESECCPFIAHVYGLHGNKLNHDERIYETLPLCNGVGESARW